MLLMTDNNSNKECQSAGGTRRCVYPGCSDGRQEKQSIQEGKQVLDHKGAQVFLSVLSSGKGREVRVDGWFVDG